MPQVLELSRQKPAFGRRSHQGERVAVIGGSAIGLTGFPPQLGEDRRQQMIRGECGMRGDLLDLRDRCARPVDARARNRSVEDYDRRSGQRAKGRVALQDSRPVGLLPVTSDRMTRRDLGLEMVLRHVLTRRGAVERLQPVAQEHAIPLGAILVAYQKEIALRTDPRRESRHVQEDAAREGPKRVEWRLRDDW